MPRLPHITTRRPRGRRKTGWRRAAGAPAAPHRVRVPRAPFDLRAPALAAADGASRLAPARRRLARVPRGVSRPACHTPTGASPRPEVQSTPAEAAPRRRQGNRVHARPLAPEPRGGCTKAPRGPQHQAAGRPRSGPPPRPNDQTRQADILRQRRAARAPSAARRAPGPPQPLRWPRGPSQTHACAPPAARIRKSWEGSCRKHCTARHKAQPRHSTAQHGTAQHGAGW